MKVVILAGGFGTRISEESYLKPKPMLEIGGKPILWHIMNYRLTNDSLSFSLNVSNKVFDELLKKEISYIIMGDDILKVLGTDEIYDLYKKLSSYYYDKYKKKEKLTNLLNNLLDKDLENYDKIFNFFESININT